ncbi:hypothetical protein QQ045_026022 [Rhodiola kirilowii]
MEGHIWIESEGLGKGCTAIFIVKLGIAEITDEAKHLDLAMVPENQPQATYPGLKVLVMDENGSPEECLRVVTPEQNVVFMDVSMPGVDGYEVAVRLHDKFRKRHERLLIVALTGNTDKLTKETCRRVGLDGVVLKPVPVDKMRSILSQLLEHRVLFEA